MDLVDLVYKKEGNKYNNVIKKYKTDSLWLYYKRKHGRI